MTDFPNRDKCRGRECLDGTETTVWVSADHSHTREGRDKKIVVDSCIADLVNALYPMAASSCCGHRQTEGRILLYDGRVLRVYTDMETPGAMPDGPWGYTTALRVGGYEQDYADGEATLDADYDFWFKDVLGLPDDWTLTRCKAEVERIVAGRVVTIDHEVGIEAWWQAFRIGGQYDPATRAAIDAVVGDTAKGGVA